MKKMLLSLAVLGFAAAAGAQTPPKPEKIIVIDGCLFREMPVSTRNVVKMHLLKTPAGRPAVGFELSEPLPERALKYAVPAEQVPEGPWLLERYAAARKAGTGSPISFGGTPILKEGTVFPAFSATDIDGRVWTNADVEGRVMVLNLWFTGCGPCRAEMPELSGWRKEMPDVMFFSSTYEEADRARPVLEERRFTWIPLVNDRQFREFVGDNGYPVTIVVDRRGVVDRVEYGTSPVQREELKERIRALRR